MAEVPRDKLANFTGIALGALGALAIIGVGAFVAPHAGDPKVIIADVLILVGVVVLLLLLLLGWKWFVKLKDKPFTQKLKQSASATPNELTAVATRAKLDDLRRTFDAGISKFKATGKDLYKLPWYLLVGEPGAGKTEAVRHSNLPFPPGLQDFLQGTGGTVNMNWWLTNQAVILDTAGRYMFEELQPGTAAEWTEFLRLLLKHRPQCPINGLILVIPANSLILDTADQIEAKAAKIAQQLDRIQRVLEVRFPVYVIVTKCDLVNGFREFFENVDDPQLQHQIMGWSNPEPLDEHFNPEQVEEHLKKVYARLSERRLGLLLDPVAHAGMRSLRIDEVDSLYSFPDSFLKLGTRLRRYLALVFVAGEWSPKPLFLRGIYFTSSMRQGQALDAELAELLRVPIESLGEKRVWEREKAYFLRDLLLKKAFPEKGLVTRAVNTRKAERGRTVALLTAGFVAAILILGFSVLGRYQLKQSIDDQQTAFWSQVSALTETDPATDLSILTPPSKGSKSRLSEKVPITTDESPTMTLGEFYGELNKWANRDVQISPVFRPAAYLMSFKDASKGINASQKEDARRLYTINVLAPLINATRDKLNKTPIQHWEQPSTDALAQLIQFESGGVPDIKILFSYVTTNMGDKVPATAPVDQNGKYVQTLADGSELCQPGKGPGVQWPGISADPVSLNKGLSVFVEYWSRRANKTSDAFDQLLSPNGAANSLDAKRMSLHEYCNRFKVDVKFRPTTLSDFSERLKQWRGSWKDYNDSRKAFYKELNEAVGDPGLQPILKLYQAHRNSDREKAKEALTLMQTRLNGYRLAGGSINELSAIKILEQSITSISTNSNNALEQRVAELGNSLLGVVTTEHGETTRERWIFDAYGKIDADLKSADEGQDLAAGESGRVETTQPSTEAVINVASTDADLIQKYMVSPRVKHDQLERALAESRRFRSIIGESGADQAELPGIPFTSVPSNSRAPAKFVPRSVANEMKAVNRCIAELNSTSGNWEILNQAALKQDSKSLQADVNAFVTEYLGYWSTQIGEFDPHAGTDWASLQKQVLHVKPDEINRAFHDRSVAVLEAISAVDTNGVQTGNGASKKALAVRALIEGPGGKTISDTVNKWRDLGDVSGNVRQSLLNVTARSFADDFLVRVSADSDPVTVYWNRIILALLTDLAKQTSVDARELLRDLSEKYWQFPLNPTSDVDLSPASINELRPRVSNLQIVAPSRKGQPGEQIRLGGRTNDLNTDSLIDTLLQGNLAPREVTLLENVSRLVAILPSLNDARVSHVSMPNSQREKRLQEQFSPNLRPAQEFWDVGVSLVTEARPGVPEIAGAIRRAWGESVDLPLGDIVWPDRAFHFNLYHLNRTDQVYIPGPERPRAEQTHWQCLRLLRRWNAVPLAANQEADPTALAAQKWYIELRPRAGPVNAINDYSLWLIVTFDVDIPALGSWPK